MGALLLGLQLLRLRGSGLQYLITQICEPGGPARFTPRI